jgi:hypothetical protein
VPKMLLHGRAHRGLILHGASICPSVHVKPPVSVLLGVKLASRIAELGLGERNPKQSLLVCCDCSGVHISRSWKRSSATSATSG